MVKIPDKLRDRYAWMKEHAAAEEPPGIVLEILAHDRVGLIADIAQTLSRLNGNITYIQAWIEHDGFTHILVQVDNASDPETIIQSVHRIPSVQRVQVRPSHRRTFGKRVIVMGGGAQVAQVAAGAIAEADRHNIRGETISVDTIPIVGEGEISEAVRAAGRLHRVGVVVLAGALMGGEITQAVERLRADYGIPVMALKMAGSICRAADLVVTDPTEAGVMAVMLISHVGQFNLFQIHGQEF